MIYVRRGDTLAATVSLVDANGAPLSLSGYTATAAARTPSGTLIATVTAVVSATSIAVTASTSAWPVGEIVEVHVVYTSGAGVVRAVEPPLQVTALAGSPHTAVVVPTSAVYEHAGSMMPRVGATLIGRGQTAQSSGAAPGLLYELDTTVTTGVAGTTEAQGESGPAGTAPAGTLTPTGNVASGWMASTKLIEFAGNASFTGIQVRRILAGTLPAAGYILDVGIGSLTSGFNGHGVIMIGYAQGSGTTFTGIGVRVLESAANLDLIGVGDDGTGAPYTPTLMSGAGGGPTGFNHLLNTWTRGPVRVVIEMRKLDGQTPTQWSLQVRQYSQFAGPYHDEFSRVSHPETGWITPVAMNGWTPDRIGVGLWNTGAAQTCDIKLSHLRVYSLGTTVL